jgi:hypothetical protein
MQVTDWFPDVIRPYYPGVYEVALPNAQPSDLFASGMVRIGGRPLERWSRRMLSGKWPGFGRSFTMACGGEDWPSALKIG